MIPDWSKNLDWDLIREKSLKYNLNSYMVAAVVQTESSGNTYACRYEIGYKYTFQIKDLSEIINCTYNTMEIMQKTSYGLMQVMGGVAYEHGLHKEDNINNRWAIALCNPELGIEYGCKHLKKKINIYGDDPCILYAAYNGGVPIKTSGGFFFNQKNVDRFYRNYQELLCV